MDVAPVDVAPVDVACRATEIATKLRYTEKSGCIHGGGHSGWGMGDLCGKYITKSPDTYGAFGLRKEQAKGVVQRIQNESVHMM